MRREIADLVFPVFRRAIEIKEGLRSRKGNWDFAKSQKELLGLLQVPVPDPLRSEMMGDQRPLDSSAMSTRPTGFLGIRYALACWLDEIFIGDSIWKDEWNENHMETALFGINVRESRFWEQAQRAQSRPTRDALEVYYLCVMLGFRGELVENPADLIAWRETVEAQITGGEDREYTPPPGLNLKANVRPLKGKRSMQNWLMIATVIGFLFIPLVVYLVLRTG